MQLRGWDLDDRGDRGCQTFFHGGPVPVRGRGVEISPPAVGDRRSAAFAPRRGLYSQCYCMTPQRQKSKQIHLPSQSCLPLGSHAIALAPWHSFHGAPRRDTAGRQLPAAISQRHAHGRAPDHHERRSDTPDRHGRPGPTPVAASPHKRHHRPNPKFGRFWVVFTCTHS